MQKTILVTILAFMLAACTTGQNNKSNTIAENKNAEIETANSAFKNGEYEKAAAEYSVLAAKYPENKNIGFYYAESLRISGKTEDAIRQYDLILKKDAGALPAIEGKALAYLQDGNLDKALGYLNDVLAKDSSRWRTINAIGIVYAMKGNIDEAMHYYDMALAVSKNNPAVINNIALSEAINGDMVKGIKLLQNVIADVPEGSPRKIRLENNLAMLYGISGNMDEAERVLRKNLPEAAVYNNLGYYAKLAKDQKLAWSYLSKALSESPVYYEKAWNNMQGLENSDSSVKMADNSKKPRTEKNVPVPHFKPN